MKKYNVNNKYIVKAKSYTDAVNLVKKLKAKDSYLEFDGLDKIDPSEESYFRKKGLKLISQKRETVGWSYKFQGSKDDILKYVKSQHLNKEEFEIYDSLNDNDVEFLSNEERQAIEDYKKAIANTADPKLLRLFAHILKEEIEHLEELENEEIEDSLKDKKPTDYKALAKELQQKFHTKFYPDASFDAIEAPYVYGNLKLDREIVTYLKSKGYKVQWDSIGDDGFYYFKDSIEDEEEVIYEVVTSHQNGRLKTNESFTTKEDLLKKYKGSDNGSIVKLNGFMGPFNNGTKNGKKVYLYEDKNTYYSYDSLDDEEANSILRKYQEWVDYDMKHYHKISAETLSKLKKAGLEVVKDKYGDYEVIARG